MKLLKWIYSLFEKVFDSLCFFLVDWTRTKLLKCDFDLELSNYWSIQFWLVSNGKCDNHFTTI